MPEVAPEKRLELHGLPRLQALVRGPEGDEILAELQTLMQREPRRAPRFQRDLFARIRISPEQPPEIAVVRDISRSGVRLRLSAAAHLDVMQARTLFIEMRLPGTRFANCAATLVRVVEHHKNGVELAFSFVEGADRDPAFDALLEQLAAETPGGR
jgi:PilZ domain-containing protein